MSRTRNIISNIVRMRLHLSSLLSIVALVVSALGVSVPAKDIELVDRASGTKYVFAHFIVSASVRIS